MFQSGPKLAPGCVVSGVSQMEVPCMPISVLPLTGLGLPGRSHGAQYIWLLPVLTLEACVRGGLSCELKLAATSFMPEVA